MAQELTKYRLLNIFYNREKEIEILRQLELKEKEIIQNEVVYKALRLTGKNSSGPIWVSLTNSNFLR